MSKDAAILTIILELAARFGASVSEIQQRALLGYLRGFSLQKIQAAAEWLWRHEEYFTSKPIKWDAAFRNVPVKTKRLPAPPVDDSPEAQEYRRLCCRFIIDGHYRGCKTQADHDRRLLQYLRASGIPERFYANLQRGVDNVGS